MKQGAYDGYVEVTAQGIQLYVNNGTSIEGNILQGMLASFVDQYNIASEIIKVAPEKLESAFTREKSGGFYQRKITAS